MAESTNTTANVEPKRRCGGLSDLRDIDGNTKMHVSCIRAHILKDMGRSFTMFEPVGLKVQVVNGLNYFAKVQTDENEYIHVRYHVGWDKGLKFHSLQEGHTVDSEIEYWEPTE